MGWENPSCCGAHLHARKLMGGAHLHARTLMRACDAIQRSKDNLCEGPQMHAHAVHAAFISARIRKARAQPSLTPPASNLQTSLLLLYPCWVRENAGAAAARAVYPGRERTPCMGAGMRGKGDEEVAPLLPLLLRLISMPLVSDQSSTISKAR